MGSEWKTGRRGEDAESNFTAESQSSQRTKLKKEDRKINHRVLKREDTETRLRRDAGEGRQINQKLNIEKNERNN